MTYNDYLSYIRWRSELLMSGRYEELARHTCVPLAVDLAGTTLDILSRDDLILQFHRMRLALNARGIAKLDPQITAVELPGCTQRVWVCWHGLNPRGAEMATAQTIYVMDCRFGGLKVKARQHPTLLVPELAEPNFRNRLVRSRA